MADTRRLVVTELRTLKTGRNEHGPWALSEVTATTEHGQAITVVLRTFDDLPTDTPIDVTVERGDDYNGEAQFFLKLPRQRGGPGMGKVNQRLDEHEERLDHLDRRVDNVERKITEASHTSVPAGAAPSPAGVAPGGDDSLPF